MSRQIIALGGGGFSMEPHNPLLDRYVLSLVNRPRPRVCFVPTASGDSQDYRHRFMAAFAKFPCETAELNLFRPPRGSLADFVMNQDLFYVGGGSTRNLLVLWREWGLDKILRRAYEAGKIMAGISAGAICWFEDGLSDSVATGELRPLAALGWLRGSFCPHWQGEPERQAINRSEIAAGNLRAGWAADDGVAVHFVDEQVHRVLSSHPEREARHFQLVEGALHEQSVEPAYLGGSTILVRRAALRDIPQLHEAHMHSIREVCKRDHSPAEIAGWGNRALDAATLESRRKQVQESFVYVVEAYGKIQGWGALQMQPDRVASLEALYLTPAVLGQGYGKLILDLLVGHARSQSAENIILLSTLTAKGFYEKMGFRLMGACESYVFGGVPVRGWPMVRDLKPEP